MVRFYIYVSSFDYYLEVNKDQFFRLIDDVSKKYPIFKTYRSCHISFYTEYPGRDDYVAIGFIYSECESCDNKDYDQNGTGCMVDGQCLEIKNLFKDL